MKTQVALLGLLLAPTAMPAVAQDQDQGEVPRVDTVTSRARPDYDPIGQKIGGFILYPDLTVQESYESNIFATPSNTKDDFITSIQPALDAKSNWNQDALNFHADSNINKYVNNSVADYTDFDVGGDGRLDIYHDARAYGSLFYRLLHEPFSSPNNLGGTKPTQYQDYGGSAAGEKEFNRLSLRLDGNYDRYDFSNNSTAAGEPLDETRRNYDETQLALRTGYEFEPQRQIYVLTSYNWRDYAFSTDISGYDRNSTGYTAALGAKYDLTGIVFADAYVGYLKQDYQDPRLQPIEGPTGNLQLTWNVTRLTTITGAVSRNVMESDIAGASGYFATQAKLRADHELLRNLLLNASFGYEQDSFKGIGRNDDYYLAGIGAKYLIDRNFWLSGGYNFQNRSSNQPGNSFDDHVVFLRLSAHL